MELFYKEARLSDIDLLTKTRIQVLRAANRLPHTADLSVVEQESRAYYRESLQNGSHVAFLIFAGEKLAGTGGISFYRVMPTCCNPSGQKAYIMNMYTAPAFRRKGIAYRTLDLLVMKARERGVNFISLEATEMGRPLYKKYGFISMQDEMILPHRNF